MSGERAVVGGEANVVRHIAGAADPAAAGCMETQAAEELEIGGLFPGFTDAEVEKQYRDSEYQLARKTRVLCIALAAVIAALSPLAGGLLLSQLPGLRSVYAVTTYGIQVPVLLLMLWTASRKTLRVQSASLGLLALQLVSAADAEWLRILGGNHGTTFPSSASYAGIGLCVLLFGLPLRQGVSVLAVFFVVSKAAELAFMHMTPQDYSSLGLDLMFVASVIIGAVRVDAARRQAHARLATSELRAHTDRLTRLSNRWGFEREADRIVRHAARERHPITLAVVDLDHFKKINDAGGHAFGDFVLAQVAQCLADQARRPLDAAGRLGGEEFVLLWYAPRDEFSPDLGNRIVTAVRKLAIPRPDDPGRCVTVSVGVASVYPKRKEDLNRALKVADECLYQAKREGRDTSRMMHCDAPAAHQRHPVLS